MTAAIGGFGAGQLLMDTLDAAVAYKKVCKDNRRCGDRGLPPGSSHIPRQARVECDEPGLCRERGRVSLSISSAIRTAPRGIHDLWSIVRTFTGPQAVSVRVFETEKLSWGVGTCHYIQILGTPNLEEAQGILYT